MYDHRKDKSLYERANIEAQNHRNDNDFDQKKDLNIRKINIIKLSSMQSQNYKALKDGGDDY
ncbi:hypothetical protein CR513_48279, partial [Mucuna pruriens]